MIASELTLSNLLPELILFIAHVGEESLESMRLISPLWNSCVLSHLRDRRYLPSLERLFLRDGTESDLNEDDDSVERPEDEEHVCMWAVLPESCAPARIGLDKWLSVHERFPGAIEVTCKPETVAKEIEEEEASNKDVHGRTRRVLAGSSLSFLSAITIAGLFAAKRQYSLGGTCALMAASPLFFFNQYSTAENILKLAEKDEKKKQYVTRMARFFSSFSHIDSLVLDQRPSFVVMKTTVKQLGNVQVKNLELRCFQTDQYDLEIVEELVRLNRIQHVSIATKFLRKKSFSDFATKVVPMGATLDIYQEKSDYDDRFFLRDRPYWELKASELEMCGISMNISCDNDADFEDRLMQKEIKMHLRIRTIENREDHYSIFDKESRGYVNY